jgi:hypothetical protein
MLHRDGITQTKPIQGNALNGRVERKIEPSGIAVHSTTNYGQFRFSNANRPIDQRHLERLYDAVGTKNLLDKYPILVTPQLLVIDGQHRLKVAEALHVPIYYTVAENMSIEDISRINDVSLKWSLANYLHYWCEMGNEDYKQIAAFAKRWHGVSVAYILKLLPAEKMDDTLSNRQMAFRSGKTTAKALPKIEKVLTWARDFEPYLGKRWAHGGFLAAINVLTKVTNYSHETMLRRIEYQGTKLVPCARMEDYLNLLGEIYNYRTHRENQLDFAALRRMEQGHRLTK